MTQEVPVGFSDVFSKTISVCQSDESYVQYSVREKMLAFSFTFLQNLSEDETAFAAVFQQRSLPWLRTSMLGQLKNEFILYVNQLLQEGTNSGEVQARPFIANYYQEVLWNAFLAILYFWAKDRSEHKENTDVMVEKTVHFALDLLAPNAVDSGIDWIQNFMKLRNTAH